MRKTILRLLPFVLCTALPQGCVVTMEDHIISEPTIRESTEWKTVRKCSSEGCYPLVNYFTRGDVSIGIESRNDVKEKVFLISTHFLVSNKVEFTFDPSLATVELADHTVLRAKGFTCSYTIADVNYLGSTPPLTGQISIQKNDCFLLFFDAPPPRVEEQFVLKFNGVTKRGQPFDIPEVIFRKGVSRY